MFSYAREGITITRADGTIIEVNDSFTRITGYSREEVLGKNPRILKSNHHGSEFYAAFWNELTANGHWSGQIWNRHKSGEIYPEMLTISAVYDEHGVTRNYVALFSDISPIKEHEKQLEYLAYHDALTSLPNRALLADRLRQAMALADRHEHIMTVAYIDLDGFKTVNDEFGHRAGDQLLLTLADRMKQALRESDTLARLGGDEFVAIFSALDGISACLPLLDRLIALISQPTHIDESEVQVSASIGVSIYPQSDEVDADQLLRQADQAMYQAKKFGKNRYHIFASEPGGNSSYSQSVQEVMATQSS